jgi:hypothetical protein
MRTMLMCVNGADTTRHARNCDDATIVCSSRGVNAARNDA